MVATYMRRIGVVGLDAHCHLSAVQLLLGSWIHFSPVCFLFLPQCENWNDLDIYNAVTETWNICRIRFHQVEFSG